MRCRKTGKAPQRRRKNWFNDTSVALSFEVTCNYLVIWLYIYIFKIQRFWSIWNRFARIWRRYHQKEKDERNLSFLWTSVQIRWNIVSGLCITRNRSPCLLRWSCLQTSEGQRRSEFHLVGLENSETPSTSSVWPSDHREDYRSCARSFYSLVQIIPKALHSD